MGEFRDASRFNKRVLEGVLEFSREHDPFSSLPAVFCPELVGRYDVKRGLLCMLVNMQDRNVGSGRKRNRERLHILLYGEPGTGKTIPLDYLSREWGAVYISANPSSASLKGDARRKDRGVQIFSSETGRVVCIDEFELMEDTDTLRDVMEIGKFTLTKGGHHEEYDAQCSVVCAANDITKLSPAVLSRFDLIYGFDEPTYDESVEIARNLIEIEEDPSSSEITKDFLKEHIGISSDYNPRIRESAEVLSQLELHFRKSRKGKTGRWISSVFRISRAIAKIRLNDWGVEEVKCALKMKSYSDSVLARALGYE